MLCNLLRPELVATSPIPLCSDAFSLFQRACPNARRSNSEVKEATRRLLQYHIPKLADRLCQMREVLLNGTVSLTEEFHMYPTLSPLPSLQFPTTTQYQEWSQHETPGEGQKKGAGVVGIEA